MERYDEEEGTMIGCLSMDDPRTNKTVCEKREMVIDTIASVSRDDREAIQISMEAAVHCHLAANIDPDYGQPDFDQWLPRVMRDFETIARKCYGVSE